MGIRYRASVGFPTVSGPSFGWKPEITDGYPLTAQQNSTIDLKQYANIPTGYTATFTEVSGASGTSVSTSGVLSVATNATTGTADLLVDLWDGLANVAQVTGLAASNILYNSVTLNWNDVSGETGYKVERSLFGSGTWAQIGTTGAGVITYVDSTVISATSYSYRVVAYDAGGNGPYSSTIDVSTPLASGVNALADWNYRSTLPGTVWANRFSTPSDPGLFWGLSPTNFTEGKRTGYIGPGVTRVGVEGMTRYAEGVIPGTGCLEQYTPANVLIGNNRWGRPLAPTTGAMAVPSQNLGNGIITEAYTPSSTAAADLDINNAGWPRLDIKTFYSNYSGDAWNKMGNGGGGIICNQSDYSTYQRTIPSTPYNASTQEITAAPADGFYIQYRIKFPTFPNGYNLLDYTSGVQIPYGGAWMGKSWLCHSFGSSNYFHEVGSLLWGNVNFPMVSYGHRADWYYGNIQSGVNTVQIQNTLNTTCTYGSPATCWKYPKDKWVTMLVHIIPGSQNPDDNGDINAWLAGTYGTLTKNQTVELWVADEDRIAAGLGYLKLLTATGYASFYSGRYLQTKSGFGLGTQYYGISNSGGSILITPETSATGFYTGCEIEFQQGLTNSLPTGIPNSKKLYAIMSGTTAFKVATTRANALAGIAIPYVDSGSDTTLDRNRVGFSVAPGYSLFQLLQQMNLTADNSPYEKPSWILYDQVICSTNFIPCPTV